MIYTEKRKNDYFKILNISHGNYKNGQTYIAPFIYNRWYLLDKYYKNFCKFIILTSNKNSLLNIIKRIFNNTNNHSSKIGFEDSKFIQPIYIKVNKLFNQFTKPKYYNEIIAKKVYHSIYHQINRILKLSRFNIIHSHQILPYGYISLIAKKELGIPFLITAHGHGIHTYPFISKIYLKHTLEVLESAERVIFVSKGLLLKAKEFGYSGNNSIIISNGVDLNCFYPMNKLKVKNILKLSLKKKYIGYIGIISKTKGADRIPRIFKYLYKKCKDDIGFIIIGGGPLLDKTKKELKGISVIYTGIIDYKEVPFWLNAIDILILPSRNEGWPSVILEANACGVPVVATNVGGISEAIGNLGIVINSKTKIEINFGIAISYLLEKPVDINLLVNHARKHTWDNVVEKEIELYRSLIINS